MNGAIMPPISPKDSIKPTAVDWIYGVKAYVSTEDISVYEKAYTKK